MRTDLFENRLLELASDILMAVSRGELPADAPVVTATARAIADLRVGRERGSAAGWPRPAAGSPGCVAATPAVARAEAWRSGFAADEGRETTAGAASHEAGGLGSGGRVTAPVEHVLAVARAMRRDRLSFAAACARQGEATAVSAQAVRNACCRWLGLSAYDWQPLSVDGADEAAIAVARRLVERQGWARGRAASAFGVPEETLGATAGVGEGAATPEDAAGA